MLRHPRTIGRGKNKGNKYNAGKEEHFFLKNICAGTVGAYALHSFVNSPSLGMAFILMAAATYLLKD